MAVDPPAPERRRPRRGSLERPINGRLYRGTWLLVGLPLLVLAFSVARPPALQPPNLPPSFDEAAAKALAADLATRWPSRLPGTAGATGATRWFESQLRPYGFKTRRQAFMADVPGRGRVHFVNVLFAKAGLSAKTIVVMAHRDDGGVGPGADDNGSGTAALLELARVYAPTGGGSRVRPSYSIEFVSTDGAVYGGIGAAWFAAYAPERQNVIAVLNLDAIAGPGPARIQVNGDTPRTPTPGLVETIRAQLAAETGREPARASTFRQLVDLGFPYSRYEQAPFVTRGIPAVTITTAPDRPADGLGDDPARLQAVRLKEIGRATQHVIDAMQQGVALAPGPSSYVYLGSRIVRGWAIELVLVGALLPFLAATVDLFARCRRRRIRIAPALRSYRSRLGFWLWCGAIFAIFTLAGAWPGGVARPPSLDDVRWPAGALIGLAILAALGWIVSRDRLFPRRPVRGEEELAGHAAALLALAVVALLVTATNPFALIFLLPSLHVWLWLPQLRESPVWARAVVLLAGLLAGPALLVWSFAGRYELGWDAPWYIAWLYAIGYAPPVGLAIMLGWAAAAGQLVALTGGRYAPYPAAAERPPRGPLRETVRRLVLARRRRRGQGEGEPERTRRALHG